MAVSTPDPMESALKKQVKNPYDIRRQQAQADTDQETDRQRDALRAQLTGQGIYDSGIRNAEERDLATRQAKALAQRQGAIDVEEGQAAERTSENEKNRALTQAGLDIQRQSLAQSGALGNRGLDIQEKGQGLQNSQFYAGLNQSGGLASRGLDIQEKGLAQSGAIANRGLDIQEKGQGQQNAQFYAGLNQSGAIANRGLDIQQQGQAQQNNQFYAGLDQAKTLALSGMDIQRASLVLQEKGMNQEDAQFFAGLGQAKALAEKGFSLQETGLELQKLGIDNQRAQFLASMAHDTQEKSKDRTAAANLQGSAQAWQSGENQLNRESAVNLENLHQNYAVDLRTLDASLQKEYATFQDAINDVNTGEDDTKKLRLQYLAESLSALDPKDPGFQFKLQRMFSLFAPDVDFLSLSSSAPTSSGASTPSNTTPASKSPSSTKNTNHLFF